MNLYSVRRPAIFRRRRHGFDARVRAEGVPAPRRVAVLGGLAVVTGVLAQQVRHLDLDVDRHEPKELQVDLDVVLVDVDGEGVDADWRLNAVVGLLGLDGVAGLGVGGILGNSRELGIGRVTERRLGDRGSDADGVGKGLDAVLLLFLKLEGEAGALGQAHRGRREVDDAAARLADVLDVEIGKERVGRHGWWDGVEDKALLKAA